MRDEPTVLSTLIRQHFRYWMSDGDAAWGTYAWGLLAERGVVPASLHESDPDLPWQILTLGALARFSNRFNDEFAEGVEGPFLTEGDFALTDIAVGRLAERFGVPTSLDDDDREGILGACLGLHTRHVMGHLVDAVGRERLFADLWAQRYIGDNPADEYIEISEDDVPSDGPGEFAYPLTDAHLDLILNGDQGVDQHVVYERFREATRT